MRQDRNNLTYRREINYEMERSRKAIKKREMKMRM